VAGLQAQLPVWLSRCPSARYASLLRSASSARFDRHIHRGADIFDEIPSFIVNRMADRMDVLDGSIGQHNPVIMLVIHASLRHFRLQFTESVAILRVDSLPDCFSGWHAFLRV
jgi:hypothetical protein